MKYPLAIRKPTTVSFGGESYTDDYQWLEEDGPAALGWQNQQNALAREWLSTRSSRAKSLEIQSRIPRLTTDWPTYAAGRLVLRHTPPDQDLQVIQVADSEQGPWKTLVDLNEMATGEPLAFDSFAPSPDGKKLLFGWGASGRELQNLLEIDVDRGEIKHSGVRQ